MAETASMSHCHRIFAWSSLICLIHGNAIRHQRDDDQPDMVGRAYPSKITGNTRTSKTIFRSSIFAKAIVKSYEPGRKTTGYVPARDGVDRSVAADWGELLTLIDGSITKIQEQMEQAAS